MQRLTFWKHPPKMDHLDVIRICGATAFSWHVACLYELQVSGNASKHAFLRFQVNIKSVNLNHSIRTFYGHDT